MSAQMLSQPTAYQYSVYIPEMDVKFSVPVITQIMSVYGAIERIDVLPRKNFNTKELDSKYKRAFIHFSVLYDLDATRDFVETINADGNFRICVDPESTWVCYKTDKKIPYTDMNVHQIAHVLNIIDDKVIDADQELFQQSQRMEQLEQRNAQLENTVAELQATILEMQRHLMLLAERK
jgi:peptidoglycan hydrolase CwlO-like protein